MQEQYWSWLLAVVGLGGFILAGQRVWWAWYINIAAQVLWFWYGIGTQQYGFILSALAYTVVFVINAYEWTKDHFKNDDWTEEDLQRNYIAMKEHE